MSLVKSVQTGMCSSEFIQEVRHMYCDPEHCTLASARNLSFPSCKDDEKAKAHRCQLVSGYCRRQSLLSQVRHDSE